MMDPVWSLEGRSAQVYRRLLIVYPPAFRARHGDDMTQLFRDRVRDTRRRGSGYAKLWLGTLRDLVANGLSERFGRGAGRDPGGTRATIPEQIGILMSAFMSDIRFALRSLRSTPMPTGLALLMLAVGIGATTSVFSVTDAVVLRPLPYRDSERLVLVASTDAGQADNTSGADYLDWRQQSSSFEDLAAHRTLSLTMLTGDTPMRVRGASVTPNMFAVLGVEAEIGRALSPESDPPEGARTVVLGDGLWRSQFAAEPDIVGTEIRLNDERHIVVGVMPPGFDFPAETQLWPAPHYRVPDPPFDFGGDPSELRGSGYIEVVGRLRDGVDLDSAQAEMTLITARLAAEYPETNARSGAAVESLHDAVVGDARSALFVLLGAVGFVLLIACANVANLLLVRASGRRQEIALRRSLGASAPRIMRQLLTESVLLALFGGLLGVLLALLGSDALLTLAPEGMPRIDQVVIDLRVLGVALFVVLGTGLLFGLAPIIELRRTDLQMCLRQGDASHVASGSRNRLRRGLIVGEVGVTLMLLVGAALMIRTLAAVMAVDPGFDPSGTVVANLVLPDQSYPQDEDVRGFYDEVLARLRSYPQVEEAGGVLTLSMRWNMRGTLWISVEGVAREEDERPLAVYQLVTPGYFEALRVPLLRGRLIDTSDDAEAPMVVMVNEAFADEHWPGRDPLGQRITWGNPEADDVTWWTVVGVVANTRLEGLDAEPVVETYLSYAQSTLPYITLVTRGEVDGLPAAIRDAVRQVDPQLALSGMASMEEIVAQSLAERRFNMLLLSSFAAVALIMAAGGLYGVLSASVTQRRREISIRKALGAHPRRVTAQVVREAMGLNLIGLALGSAGSVGLTRVIASHVHGVSATDPLSYAVGALLLALFAVLASYLPARRAARTDAMLVLR